MNITQKQKGILFMILSALSFASMQVVVRMSREIPTMEQICVRNLFILIVSFFIIRKKHGSYYGPKKYQPYLFGRSFFGFLGLITLFYASSHAAQGDVTVLNKLSPIFVTLLAAVFMKEKLSPIQIPALVLSVLGAFIVFRPSFQSDPFPLIVALLSAITSGIAYTFLGYFKGKVDGITVIMHFSTFSVFGSLPFVIGNFVMPDLRQFMLLMLISLFGSLGQVFITYAYRFAPGIRDQYLQLFRNPVQHSSRSSGSRRACKTYLDPWRRPGCDRFHYGVYLWKLEKERGEVSGVG
ncbi:MAG: DMT family transporter [Lachnospiraceae bacterium]